MPYTAQEMAETLRVLDISPLNDRYITDREARRIVSWRIRRECGLPESYTCSAGYVRARVHQGALPNYHPMREDGEVNAGVSLYDYRDLFRLRCDPRRRVGKRLLQVASGR